MQNGITVLPVKSFIFSPLERAEKRVIRVGVSLMTPSTLLVRLLPEVRRRCPGMSMQVVTFENGPEAARSLADLGRDMDVVVGVFDDEFLRYSAGRFPSISCRGFQSLC